MRWTALTVALITVLVVCSDGSSAAPPLHASAAEPPQPQVSQGAGPSASGHEIGDEGPAPVAEVDPAGDTDSGLRFVQVPPGPGERLLWDTRVKIDLDAEVGVGFLKKEVEYKLSEREEVAVDILAGEDDELVVRLDYLTRKATSKAPLVGEKTKERRVHGKIYRVTGTEEHGLNVTDDGGGGVRAKEVPYVTRTWRTVGGRPPLFDVLPADESVAAGDTFEVQTETAKRLLGLPLDELDVDTLSLTFTGAEDEVALFDAVARLSGRAELGGAPTSLEARLKGTIAVSLNGCRLLAVDMRGRTHVERDGDGMLDAEGSGPLTLERRVTER